MPEEPQAPKNGDKLSVEDLKWLISLHKVDYIRQMPLAMRTLFSHLDQRIKEENSSAEVKEVLKTAQELPAKKEDPAV